MRAYASRAIWRFAIAKFLPKSWLQWTILGLLILGVGLRFYDLDRQVFWMDEVRTAMRATGAVETEVRARLETGDRLSIADLQTFQTLQPERGWTATWQALATHPEHPPLYYALVRQAMTWVADPIWAARGLSAAISLLAFPSVYWLARELFAEPRVAALALGLYAVSPFQVFYAREARQYSLLAVALSLSGATLLRALRLKTAGAWRAYAVAVAMGLYTSVMFVLAIAAHGTFLISSGQGRARWKFLRAVVGGVAVFLPWIAVVAATWPLARSETAWTQLDLSWPVRLQLWGLHFSTGFWDWGFGLGHPLTLWVPPLFAIACLGLFWRLYRSGQRRAALFLGALVAVNFLALALPDVLLSGRRSAIARYFSQTYLALQLLAAGSLGSFWEQRSAIGRRWGPRLLAILLAGGISSCLLGARATSWWWTKPIGTDNLEAAAAINATPAPLLLVGSVNSTTIGNLLSLSHALNPDVAVVVVPATATPATYRACQLWLYAPPPDLTERWQAMPDISMRSVASDLLSVQRTGPSCSEP